MKKVFLVLIVVSMVLCACTTAGQKLPQNVGKPIENESAPAGSSGTVTTQSTGTPSTQGSQPATQTSVPTTSVPATSSPATSAPATSGSTPPVTTAPHTHQYTATVTQKATCEDLGVKTYTCSCSASYREAIPATGHSWGQWIETKIATAAEMGEEVRTCNNCDEVQNHRTSKIAFEGVDYFYNPDNNIIQSGQVAVRPRCVFWSGGKLYVQAFLINGTGSTAVVNKVALLTISNPSVTLAQAGNFSNSGAVLAPNQHSLIHLVFNANEVANYGASLASLHFEWSLDLG